MGLLTWCVLTYTACLWGLAAPCMHACIVDDAFEDPSRFVHTFPHICRLTIRFSRRLESFSHTPLRRIRYSAWRPVVVGAAGGLPSAVVRLTVSRGLQPSLLRIITRPTAAGARRPLTAGPVAIFLIFIALLSAFVRGMVRKVANNVRGCSCCHGFGVQRCRLCEGRGVVGWEGKWEHYEPCPSCLGKRFTRCDSCGGFVQKPIFKHCSTVIRLDLDAPSSHDAAPAPAGAPQPFRFVFMDD